MIAVVVDKNGSLVVIDDKAENDMQAENLDLN